MTKKSFIEDWRLEEILEDVYIPPPKAEKIGDVKIKITRNDEGIVGACYPYPIITSQYKYKNER